MSGDNAVRAALHAAVWVPFAAGLAALVRGGWRAVGDGAAIALRSWGALTAHGTMVGQPTRLAHGLYDPGPLQFWLLAIPVHLDPVHGVLWGAALWCAAAASLTIEAVWSVHGRMGGVLAAAMILGVVVWRPQMAVKPYWNPWFATMFFLAALAACWAVMSGRRQWWPVLVVTASVAAQAHLMFALASGSLVLLALITGLADASRPGAGHRWVAAGLAAGLGCWAAPVIQQLTSEQGNLAALITRQGSGGQRTGPVFALNTLAASTRLPPLWWPLPRGQLDPGQLMDGRWAVFGAAVLALTVGALAAAVCWLRSRMLARLATLSLCVTATALLTFSRIPVRGDSLSRLYYLVTVMFPVGLLAWLTLGAAGVLVVMQVSGRQAGLAQPAGQPGARALARRWSVPAAAVLPAVLLLAALPAIARRADTSSYDLRLGHLAGAAARLIERDLSGRALALSVVSADAASTRRLTLSLDWVLTADGYRPQRGVPGLPGSAPHVTVDDRRARITVTVTADTGGNPARSRPAALGFTHALDHRLRRRGNGHRRLRPVRPWRSRGDRPPRRPGTRRTGLTAGRQASAGSFG
jgi:hypothetical protein